MRHSLHRIVPIDVDPEELFLDELVNEDILVVFTLVLPAFPEILLYLLHDNLINFSGVLLFSIVGIGQSSFD